MTKVCGKCNKEQELERFNANAKGKYGRHSVCKACTLAYNETRRDRSRELAKAYYQSDPGRYREYGLKSRYGLTRQGFDALLTKQGGECAMCRTPTPMGRGQFHVDHDHATGKVRGLLCHKCNVALGQLGDNPLKAANMLARYAVLTNGN